MKSIRQRIEELRQQPEDKRLRAATLLTAGSGGLLVVLWLAVLLPLQIRLNTPNAPTGENQTALSTTTSPAASQLAIPLPAGRQADQALQVPGVAGLRTAAPAPQVLVTTVSPSPSPSPSPTPLGLPTAVEP